VSNLAVIILGFALLLFAVSQIAKRSPENVHIKKAVKILSFIVLALSAIYFYQRFLG